jgi:hypothetical protein
VATVEEGLERANAFRHGFDAYRQTNLVKPTPQP